MLSPILVVDRLSLLFFSLFSNGRTRSTTMNSRHLFVLLLTWIICSIITVCVEARVSTLWPYRERRWSQKRRRERVLSSKNKLLKQSKFMVCMNCLFQKDRTGILRTFPFHAMSGAGRNSQGRYDGVKEILGSKYQGLPTSILGK